MSVEPRSGQEPAEDASTALPAASASNPRWGMLWCGIFLILAYFRLDRRLPMVPDFSKAMVFVDWREGIFWASFWLLWMPGLFLVFGALAPVLERFSARVAAATAWLAGRWGQLALIVVWTLSARWSRFVLTFDLPVVADEGLTDFGARIWAAGELTAKAFDPAWGFEPAYIFFGGGRMCSFDFPGTIAFHALALATGLGPWFFALMSAISGWVLARAAARIAPRHGFWTVAALWTCSPMIWALSLTMHGQLTSRCVVACCFASFLHAYADWREGKKASLAQGLLLGLGAAVAGLVRPAEAFFLLLPLGGFRLWMAYQERRWAPVGGAAALAALALPLHLLYNATITGSWWLPPRALDAAADSTFHQSVAAMWDLLGTNSGFNLLMLSVFFVGPVLWPMWVAAHHQPRHHEATLAQLLSVTVGAQLFLGLLHENTGVHLVGPIHYSEAAIPLTLLAVLAIEPLRQMGLRLGVHPSRLACLAAALLLGLVVFSAEHGRFLVKQAEINRAPLEATAELPPSIVIADPYELLWRLRPEFAAGSWTRKFPPPDPYLRDRVIFAYVAIADVEALRRDFPDRQLFRLTYQKQGPPFRLERIAPGPVPAAH